MTQEINKHTLTIFEQIKHTDENGNEYWMARQLAKVFEYTDFRNFISVIDKAKEACKNSGQDIENHLVEFNEVVAVGSGATHQYPSYKLSRYACYLIVQNADPSKELIQLLQTLAPETKIVVRGYEDGYNGILQLNAVKIKPKADAHWYDGEYERSTDAEAIDAIDLYGDNQNPKDDLK